MFSRLAVRDFRNIEAANLDLGTREVFFVGENGQGKTNLLEAIYLLCYASSFRVCQDEDLIRRGVDECSIEGRFESDAFGAGEQVRIEISKLKKTVTIDGKSIKDRRELVEAHPCVVFSHDDMEFATGSPERRRWFFDQTTSLAYPIYIDSLRNYKKVLKTRNACLRERRIDLLDILDEQMIEHGIELMDARSKAIAYFSGVFSETYSFVSQLTDKVEIAYRPSWKSADKEIIREELIQRRDSDIETGMSALGPHRDRFHFISGKQNFSQIASTGQLRLLSLVMRSCQARYFSERSGKKPILLFDDVLLELDPNRRKRFLETIPEYEQAFSAFLPGEPHEAYKKESTMVYHVEAGRYSRVD
jgi:DNA replication and repair protein RecF